jgi:hypothetical protein
MSNIKREIYELFSLRKIYLTMPILESITAEIKHRSSKGESYFDLINEYTTNPSFEKYNKKEKGAYVLEPRERHITKRAVIRIDGYGNEKEFESIYLACKETVGNINAAGNISKVCNGKTKSAYGYFWKWF